MISADAFISEIVPGGTMIKVVKLDRTFIYEGKAGEIDFDFVCPYDVLMVRPISMPCCGNALEITIG